MSELEITELRLKAIETFKMTIDALETIKDIPMPTLLDKRVFEALAHMCQDEDGEISAFCQSALTWLKLKHELQETAQKEKWDELRFWVEEVPAVMPIRKYYRIRQLGERQYIQISKSPQLVNHQEDGETEFELDDFVSLSTTIDPQLLEDLTATESALKDMSYKEAEPKLVDLLKSWGFNKVTPFSDEDWEIMKF